MGGGGMQWSDWTYIAFQLSPHPYLCTCKIRKQYDKNLKYEKQTVHILGALGALPVTQGYQHFRVVRPHHRADICITGGQNNH